MSSQEQASWRGVVGNVDCLCVEGIWGRQQSSEELSICLKKAWVLFLCEPFVAQAWPLTFAKSTPQPANFSEAEEEQSLWGIKKMENVTLCRTEINCCFSWLWKEVGKGSGEIGVFLVFLYKEETWFCHFEEVQRKEGNWCLFWWCMEKKTLPCEHWYEWTFSKAVPFLPYRSQGCFWGCAVANMFAGHPRAQDCFEAAAMLR